jgi:hypothetical protein
LQVSFQGSHIAAIVLQARQACNGDNSLVVDAGDRNLYARLEETQALVEKLSGVHRVGLVVETVSATPRQQQYDMEQDFIGTYE